MVVESDESPFHSEWERRAFALALAMGFTGSWTLDMSRGARERVPGYREASYYELWFEALTSLIAERGLASVEEMSEGSSRDSPKSVGRVLRGDEVDSALSRRSSCERPAATPPSFGVGERVRALAPRRRRVDGVGFEHVRAPAYLEGREGEIETIHGHHVFADASARGDGDSPQWLYGVRFGFGDYDVRADLWESYLRRAS